MAPTSSRLSRTLFRSLCQSLRKLRDRRGRVRFTEPVDVRLWGHGLNADRVPQVELLKSMIPDWLLAEEACDSLLQEIEIGEEEDANDSGSHGYSLPGLKEAQVVSILKLGFQKGDDLGEGFSLSRYMAMQVTLRKSTSMHVTDDLVRVEATSVPLADASGSRNTFCYRISIENVGEVPFILLGRHWEIYDNGVGRVISEVPRGSSGVVGHRPLLKPKQRFVYASGCSLESHSGWIGGSFQMATVEDDDDDVSTAAGGFEGFTGKPTEFDAIVAPIPLNIETD
mmetsp:Transcript_12845/g.17750  ORF Transcript_12845/g.17750 Transcript_12845/m.17750 type:complete len:283 (+) Transcript_12845:15-863(+)